MGDRSSGGDRRYLLLDSCLVAILNAISAMLWSPDDVRWADGDVDAGAVARRYREWRVDVASDEDALVEEIVAAVAGWLEPGPADTMPT
jgi:hypothetical protein